MSLGRRPRPTCTVAPSRPWVAAPFSMISSAMRLARFDGTAKPTPMLPASVRRAAGREDRDVDADELALGVEQRAARVAGVDRGIRLDDRQRHLAGRVGLLRAAALPSGFGRSKKKSNGSARAVALAAVALAAVALGRVVGVAAPPTRRRDRAVERADDAVGDGAREAERRADRHRRVADVELVGVGELDRRQAAASVSLMTARS